MSYGHPKHYEQNKAWFQATPPGKSHRRPWTDEDDVLILAKDEVRPDRWRYTIPKLAKMLGRTRGAVATRRSRLLAVEQEIKALNAFADSLSELPIHRTEAG